MNLINTDDLRVPSDIPYKLTVKRIIMQQPVAFDMDMVLDQLEDYGKYKGLLHCEGEGFVNYIPVSVAKQIVKGRGLDGVLGYMD